VALAIWCASLALSLAEANGGTVRVGNQRAGPYDLTVFTDPTPVRPGVCDVSVAVARAGSSDLVQDAQVTVRAVHVGRQGDAVSAPATHERATNKLFYAADVPLASAGRWRIDVEVKSALGEGAVSFEVEAEEAGFLDNPAAVGAVVVLPVVAVAWLLSRARSRRRTYPLEKGTDGPNPSGKGNGRT
jgi:hypothetical protein